MRKCIHFTKNRTVITAYDQFIFMFNDIRKTRELFLDRKYRESFFKYWQNPNGLNENTAWLVGSFIERLMTLTQLQKDNNPNLSWNDSNLPNAVYFILSAKKTLSSSIDSHTYNQLIDKFLDYHLAKGQPHYACHIHNRKKVFNEILKLNKNGLNKFKVRLKEGYGEYFTIPQIWILWFELQIQFILFVIIQMESKFDPDYVRALVESYKTRKDFHKIRANCFFNPDK